jgi:hypothetical protein
MKKFFPLFLVVFAFLITTSSASAQGLKSVCSSVASATSGRTFIYKNSAPLRTGGIGTPIRGFREEPTLIMNGQFSRTGTTIYNNRGQRLGSCPWASAQGHVGGRYRCTFSTRSLRRLAVSSTRLPLVYFALGAKKCVAIPDAGKCFGSSKGLCSRVLS